jgi:hypothetical protein
MSNRMAIEGWSPGPTPVLWPSAVTYFALLPDPLPAPNGYSMRVPMPPLDIPLSAPGTVVDSTVTIRCWQVQAPSGLDFGAIRSIDSAMRAVLPARMLPDPRSIASLADAMNADAFDTYVTVIEMRADVPMLTSTAILAGFERSAAALHEFHRAVRVTTRAEIPPLAVERLHQLVPFATSALDGRWHDQTGWIVAHPRLPLPVAPDLITASDLQPMEAHMDYIRRANPWSLYVERLLTAAACIDDGDFSKATIETAIAIEGLLDDALALSHWDLGTPIETAYKQSRAGIVTRVVTHLPRALDDHDSIWSVNEAGPAARWKQHVADQRNLIVHRGFQSSFDDAHEALSAAQNLAEHLAQRFLANVDRVPRATLVLLGEAGIKKAGRFTPRVQALSGLDRLDVFHAWQDALLVERDDVLPSSEEGTCETSPGDRTADGPGPGDKRIGSS